MLSARRSMRPSWPNSSRKNVTRCTGLPGVLVLGDSDFFAQYALCVNLPSLANLLIDPGFDLQSPLAQPTAFVAAPTATSYWWAEGSTIISGGGTAPAALSSPNILSISNCCGFVSQVGQNISASQGQSFTLSGYFNGASGLEGAEYLNQNGSSPGSAGGSKSLTFPGVHRPSFSS